MSGAPVGAAAAAAAFAALHRRGDPLVLANVWDVASACIVERCGATALATTSAAVAWSLGAADGERIGLEQVIAAVGRIVGAVSVPVSADLEGGYADTREQLGRAIAGVIGAGAVGINLEDADHRGPGVLREIADQVDRVAVTRSSADVEGVALFINARIDTYLLQAGEANTRMAETLSRATAYVAAGADGIFVPGLTDPEQVSVLAAELTVPLSVLACVGSPSVAEFARLGVGRVSVGPAIAQRAYGIARAAAQELFTSGTYESLRGGEDYAAINGLFQ